VTYHGRGFDRGTSETVTVSNTVQSLSLVIDSKPVWSVNSGVYNGAPMMVMRKRGESVAQALESQKKSIRPDEFIAPDRKRRRGMNRGANHSSSVLLPGV
jgi:hypothetical protein